MTVFAQILSENTHQSDPVMFLSAFKSPQGFAFKDRNGKTVPTNYINRLYNKKIYKNSSTYVQYITKKIEENSMLLEPSTRYIFNSKKNLKGNISMDDNEQIDKKTKFDFMVCEKKRNMIQISDPIKKCDIVFKKRKLNVNVKMIKTMIVLKKL